MHHGNSKELIVELASHNSAVYLMRYSICIRMYVVLILKKKTIIITVWMHVVRIYHAVSHSCTTCTYVLSVINQNYRLVT